jgi:2-oxoglutarate ferredoxin oxidoreductase subunit gamma
MELVFAGFGGQGVLTLGLIFARIAMENDKNVTWMPAYGPTMRGGKAYSVVKFSDEQIGGPDMEEIDVLVAMNEPSLEYAKLVKKGGLIAINSDNVSEDTNIREDVDVIRLPFVALSNQANNAKGANIVAGGAILKKTNMFELETAKKVLKDFFEEKGKSKYVVSNESALMMGYEGVE